MTALVVVLEFFIQTCLYSVILLEDDRETRSRWCVVVVRDAGGLVLHPCQSRDAEQSLNPVSVWT